MSRDTRKTHKAATRINASRQALCNDARGAFPRTSEVWGEVTCKKCLKMIPPRVRGTFIRRIPL